MGLGCWFVHKAEHTYPDRYGFVCPAMDGAEPVFYNLMDSTRRTADGPAY